MSTHTSQTQPTNRYTILKTIGIWPVRLKCILAESETCNLNLRQLELELETQILWNPFLPRENLTCETICWMVRGESPTSGQLQVMQHGMAFLWSKSYETYHWVTPIYRGSVAGPGVFFFWNHFRLSLCAIRKLRMRRRGQRWNAADFGLRGVATTSMRVE